MQKLDKGRISEVIYFHDILEIGSCIIDAPFVLFCLQERPRKRARTNGSNFNGASGEKCKNGGRSNTGSDSGQQGSSSASSGSSSRLGGSSSAAGGNGGAIIESMHHHGKGVYSGTFSGMSCSGATLKCHCVVHLNNHSYI